MTKTIKLTLNEDNNIDKLILSTIDNSAFSNSSALKAMLIQMIFSQSQVKQIIPVQTIQTKKIEAIKQKAGQIIKDLDNGEPKKLGGMLEEFEL